MSAAALCTKAGAGFMWTVINSEHCATRAAGASLAFIIKA
jgi:hypothetical protein